MYVGGRILGVFEGARRENSRKTERGREERKRNASLVSKSPPDDTYYLPVGVRLLCKVAQSLDSQEDIEACPSVRPSARPPFFIIVRVCLSVIG